MAVGRLLVFYAPGAGIQSLHFSDTTSIMGGVNKR